MSNKVIKNLRSLSKDELGAKVRKIETDLFDVRMKKVTGQLEDSAQLWRLRKELARVKTLQTAATAARKA
jgi:large subunit ribosomal protein L29